MNGRPSLKLSKLQICSDATIFVTASTGGSDGRALIFDDFRESYSWLKHNTPEVMRDNIHLSAAESFSHRVSCKILKLQQFWILWIFRTRKLPPGGIMGIKLTNLPSAAPWRIIRRVTKLLSLKLEKHLPATRRMAGAGLDIWALIMFTVNRKKYNLSKYAKCWFGTWFNPQNWVWIPR